MLNEFLNIIYIKIVYHCCMQYGLNHMIVILEKISIQLFENIY